jgi:crotonobetainyl-CoA:carnitine CoA-transferase CaiB-like acyl-CoA transferase
MSTPELTLPFHGLPAKSTVALDLLAGVKVLDLTTSIAGPYAGQLLADLGATVVKIEKPRTGDDCRAWGPPFLHGESLWFMSVNRGKQSVTLDIGSPAGQGVLHQLVAECDVVLLNLVARAQRKLGVDAETLTRINPRLVHVSLTGFGVRGSRADLPCYDLIAEGYSGVMDLTGEAETPPQKVGTPAADLLAGSDAAMAVLAALLRRERDGKGCEIDVSMVESMSRFMAPRLMPYLGSGEVSRRTGGRDSVIAIYQVFETADGPMTLGLGNDAIWRRFWDAVGQPEVGANPEFASNADRRAQREVIVQRIAALLATQPRAHWLALLSAARVPAGPIQRLDELAQDEALHEAGFIYRMDGPDGPIPQVGLGIRFDGRTEGTAVPPPKLGADTDDILRTWLDCDAAHIAQLRAQRTV